jgi:hypothetical protein
LIWFKEMNLLEKLAVRLFPARRRKYEQDLQRAIQYLVSHPEAPCVIEGTVMPHCQICLAESPNHAPFCPGARCETPQAFDIQALQSQIIDLQTRVRQLELALDALSISKNSVPPRREVRGEQIH